MKLVSRISWWSWLLLALASCGDGHPAASGGSCDDGAECDCPNGRPGSSVCDVDTKAFVMCRCDTPTQHADEDVDAGSDRSRTSAAGSGGSQTRADAGKPAADGGKIAAADGGRMAEAAGVGGDDDGNQDGDGAAGKGAAGHPGKALGHTKGHGQDP